MNTMSTVKRSILTAACIALCVVLPLAFHAIPNAGSIYSPIHIPVLLCGLICGWPYGLLCGISGVLLGTLITGMPPVAYMPPMLIEMAVYGLVTGLMMRFVRTGRHFADLYLSLIAAMLVGRLVAGGARALIFAPGAYSMAAWISAYFVTCWPAIVIQIVLIPAIIIALEKSRLIPVRYPKARG